MMKYAFDLHNVRTTILQKKKCPSTTQRQYPSTIQHCNDNIHKEFGTDKSAKILLEEGKLVLWQNLILNIYTEIQQLDEGGQLPKL